MMWLSLPFSPISNTPYLPVVRRPLYQPGINTSHIHVLRCPLHQPEIDRFPEPAPRRPLYQPGIDTLALTCTEISPFISQESVCWHPHVLRHPL